MNCINDRKNLSLLKSSKTKISNFKTADHKKSNIDIEMVILVTIGTL